MKTGARTHRGERVLGVPVYNITHDWPRGRDLAASAEWKKRKICVYIQANYYRTIQRIRIEGETERPATAILARSEEECIA